MFKVNDFNVLNCKKNAISLWPKKLAYTTNFMTSGAKNPTQKTHKKPHAKICQKFVKPFYKYFLDKKIYYI